ncbi:MAG: YqeG family HAD IIIA-type phosphatase [Planctomycetaceae bacterium]|nr:YqeG family HAD IIIA-type phosphatase [Planctomycetaceae bacterium]
MSKFFRPNLILNSVTEITPALLREHGLRFLLLDVDCTLKRYRDTLLPESSLRWIESLQQANIGLCLLSNGKKHRIQQVAEQTALPYVAAAMKPLPFGIRTAISSLGFDKAATGIAGDQIFADILAGRWAKIFTIYVAPIHPEEEHWYTRIKRPLEKRLLPHF